MKKFILWCNNNSSTVFCSICIILGILCFVLAATGAFDVLLYTKNPFLGLLGIIIFLVTVFGAVIGMFVIVFYIVGSVFLFFEWLGEMLVDWANSKK